jgi:hypothetical protein
MQAEVFGGKSCGKKPLGRNRHSQDDNIKMAPRMDVIYEVDSAGL